MPMTPFIGVRISWLMLARNSLFDAVGGFGGILRAFPFHDLGLEGLVGAGDFQFSQLQIMNVRAGAKPFEDVACAVSQRHAADQPPAVTRHPRGACDIQAT